MPKKRSSVKPAYYVSKKHFYKLRINCMKHQKAIIVRHFAVKCQGTSSTMWLRISMHGYEKSANMCTDAVLIVY